MYIFKIDAKVLELGAGNCKLAEFVSAKYKNFYATDISLSMLKSSKKKKLNRICCDMTELPFKSEFDFIFSNFDGVNYILKQKSLSRLFNEVFNLLKKEGVFTFDVSLERNSLNFVESKSIEGRSNGYSFRRISHYNKRQEFTQIISIFEMNLEQNLKKFTKKKFIKSILISNLPKEQVYIQKLVMIVLLLKMLKKIPNEHNL